VTTRALALLLTFTAHVPRAICQQPDGAPVDERWGLHAQTTLVSQYALRFRAPYSGANSLTPNTGRETWDATLYLGARLWPGAELWVNPEVDQGFGLDGTLGVAGFPNGEAYKVGAVNPYLRLPRLFLRQTLALGGPRVRLSSDQNQLATTTRGDRLVLTAGKFAVWDWFDGNRYAHEPRSDFLNWALIDTGTFDYAADSWGYTVGVTAEWYQGAWTLRACDCDLSIVPNSPYLDRRYAQFQWIGEIERRHTIGGRPGKVVATAFLTRGRMGRFDAALSAVQGAPNPASTEAVRRYAGRGGVGLSIEQEVAADLGLFARAGVADGNVEPYEFSDIDRTAALGMSLAGGRWGRPHDTFGLAAIRNAISAAHAAYLDAGGLGILIGDGKLPHASPEWIVETLYSVPALFTLLTLDYQLIVNPAYNPDRGPVSVVGARLHAQF
jgi:high affinity Mn2+ porin